MEHESFIKDLIANIDKFKNIVFHVEVDKNKAQKSAYIRALKQWLLEKTVKNQMIKSGFKKESVNRPRQRVYWIDFGVNIGCEFSYPHFCVVIKEFNNTAIVVPISSEKDDDPEYKTVGNLFVPIGVLEDLPNDKRPCYALVNQIRSVSKSRLSDYRDVDKNLHQITLNEKQMKLIFDAVCSIGQQEIKTKNKKVIACNTK